MTSGEAAHEYIKAVCREGGKEMASAVEFAISVIEDYMDSLEERHGMTSEEITLKLAATINECSSYVL